MKTHCCLSATWRMLTKTGSELCWCTWRPMCALEVKSVVSDRKCLDLLDPNWSHILSIVWHAGGIPSLGRSLLSNQALPKQRIPPTCYTIQRMYLL